MAGAAAAAEPILEPRRPGTVADRAENGAVGELAALSRRAQQQPAAAHVPAPDEIAGEEQPRAEDLEQDVDILARRDAAEENDLRVGSREGGQLPRVAMNGRPVARVRDVDVDAREAAHLRRSDGQRGR